VVSTTYFLNLVTSSIRSFLNTHEKYHLHAQNAFKNFRYIHMFNSYPVNSTTARGWAEVKNREAEDGGRCSMWLKLTSIDMIA
jgi:hypothetical protein